VFDQTKHVKVTLSVGGGKRHYLVNVAPSGKVGILSGLRKVGRSTVHVTKGQISGKEGQEGREREGERERERERGRERQQMDCTQRR